MVLLLWSSLLGYRMEDVASIVELIARVEDGASIIKFRGFL